METPYLNLTEMSLARIFKPGQQLELSVNRTGEKDIRFQQLSVRTEIVSLQNQRLVLHVLGEKEIWFNILRPGRVVTIQNGRDNSLMVFKSKIANRQAQEDYLQVTVETPRVMSSKERRNKVRVPLVAPVVYQVLNFRDQDLSHLADKVGVGECQNLSEGGITFLTALRLPPGLVIWLEISSPNRTISLTGVVRRAQPLIHSFIIGVQFLQVTPQSQSFINDLLAQNGQRLKTDLAL